MSGKRYPEEFRIEAVKQVTERGCTLLRLKSTFHFSDRSWPTSLGSLIRKNLLFEFG